MDDYSIKNVAGVHVYETVLLYSFTEVAIVGRRYNTSYYVCVLGHI